MDWRTVKKRLQILGGVDKRLDKELIGLSILFPSLSDSDSGPNNSG